MVVNLTKAFKFKGRDTFLNVNHLNTMTAPSVHSVLGSEAKTQQKKVLFQLLNLAWSQRYLYLIYVVITHNSLNGQNSISYPEASDFSALS